MPYIHDDKVKELELKTNEKSILNMQNILAGFLIAVIVAVALGFASSDGAVVGMIIIPVVFLGIVLVAIINGIVSSVKLIKNKDQMTVSEKKKWLIFDAISFLVVPILMIIISVALGNILGAIVPSIVFIIFASGVQTVVKNKDGSFLERRPGWFLIAFGVVLLAVLLLLFLTE